MLMFLKRYLWRLVVKTGRHIFLKEVTAAWKIISLLLVFSCNAQKNVVNSKVDDSLMPLAFPGAEGYGKFTTGGRGGKVYIVNTLNDKGPGSFREAAEAKGKRIIVFAVDGIIHLETKLNIRGDVTVAGHSAPGDGICIADQPVQLSGDNIIVRYLRFRMGDKYQKGGMVDGNGGDDAFGGTKRKNIIIDHCSISWSTDEAFSIYGGDSTTLQWNIISEPLNYSYHFEDGNSDFEHHGYGAIWGGKHLTAHHNLFAHCYNRNPRFDGIRNIPEENVDYRSNVIYNWGINTIYAGEGGNYNIVNNYFKYGPSTKMSARYRIVNPGKEAGKNIAYGKWFVEGNYVDGDAAMTANNNLGIIMDKNATEVERGAVILSKHHKLMPIRNESAVASYENVLKQAGASHRRDTLDERITNDVRNRTGKLIDVQGGWPHGTAYEQTKDAWPILKSLPAPLDTDRDGMPDDWEKKNKLDADKNDASLNSLHPHYTNIEVYLNSILK